MAERREADAPETPKTPKTPKEQGDADVPSKVERQAREVAERGSRELIRLLARGREELEDIWAEAQNLRRGR